MSRVRFATLAGLIALALPGCGESQAGTASDPGSAPAKIRAGVERVWDDMYEASRAGDGKRFCRHTTTRYARRLAATTGKKTCAEAVRSIGAYIDDALAADAKPRYSRFATHGKSASIRTTLSAHDGPLRNDVRFRFVDGEWKVDRDSGDGA